MFVGWHNYSPRLKVAADPTILGGWPAIGKLTSGLPVTQEHPTERAGIAFAEFTFVSDHGARRDSLNLMSLPCVRLFEGMNTLEVAMT